MNNDQQQKQLIDLVRNASADQLQDVITIALSHGGRPAARQPAKPGTPPLETPPEAPAQKT